MIQDSDFNALFKFLLSIVDNEQEKEVLEKILLSNDLYKIIEDYIGYKAEQST